MNETLNKLSNEQKMVLSGNSTKTINDMSIKEYRQMQNLPKNEIIMFYNFKGLQKEESITEN